MPDFNITNDFYPYYLETDFPLDGAGEKVLDIRRVLANYSAKQVLANGWYINSTNKNLKKYIETIFSERNKLDSLFLEMEIQLSLYGRFILTVDNTYTGIKLSTVAPFSRVGYVYVKENIAVIGKRIVWDQRKFYVKEFWDTKQVRREFYDNSKTSVVLATSTKIDSRELPQKLEFHNSGFLPVHKFNNLNSYPQGEKPDWFNVRHIETLLYELFTNLKKEIEYNRTRVFGDFEDRLANDPLAIKRLSTDFIINTHANADNPDSITILKGDPQIKSYTDGINDLIDLYFKGSGGARQSEAQIQQSATKEIFMRNDDVKTARFKRRNREFEIKRLLGKVIQLAKTNPTDAKYIDLNVKYDDFSVVIREGQETRPLEYMNDIQMKIQLGMMSISDAISNDLQISKEDALLKMKEVMKEKKEFQELYEGFNASLDNNQDNNQKQNGNKPNKDNFKNAKNRPK